jgi:DNA-binding MltR family transcriptional regulator
MDNIERDLRKRMKAIVLDEFKQVTLNNELGDIYDEFEKPIINFMNFRATLSEETDRGCILMSAALLDHELEEILKSYLIDDKKVVNNLLSNNGGLGNFSARIDMVYALGLISEKIYKDLHIIRKIRNDFAHIADPISFETQSIKDRCSNLYYNNFTHKVDTRSHFIRVVSGILGILYVKKSKCSNIMKEKDVELTYEKKEKYTGWANSIINKVLED